MIAPLLYGVIVVPCSTIVAYGFRRTGSAANGVDADGVASQRSGQSPVILSDWSVRDLSADANTRLAFPMLAEHVLLAR
jgi:hypothetical protein